MKGALQELDPEEAMTKSKNSWRGGTDLPGQPDPASGQGAESLRAFKRPSTVRRTDRLRCLWVLEEARAAE
jgi:hypothetical protein